MSGTSHLAPANLRNLRACMVCGIIRTDGQFKASGCPNCDSFLELAGNPDAVQECTSQVFEGMITVSDTSKSWAARYLRLEGYVPGLYAIQVEGVLPEDAAVAAENAGVVYIPRDGSVSEALPTDA
ncbi:putative transcriptional elongation protein Spt4 [Westerdykella ornata]|uniref:Transcription elongation factor SPT4 n=1 Tax=Westerdykella ornata TaxID=318751 RepID=A0A6A6JCD5_WESOR|nr:putative transcriptional elongation protein Spt4 [Westerdykella ornata]KAF2274280.1 putative transcriptional elongation protein Spt4 [Westerdykella ornata]